MTNKRQRPTHHEGDRAVKMTVLDEMETAAQSRIQGGAERMPLTGRQKLNWSHKEEGFHYLWATDSETHPVSLQDYLEAGYTFDRYNSGSRKGEHVTQNSKGCMLYLMRQPTELFLIDEEAKHAKSRAAMKEIRSVGKREYAGDSKEMGKGEAVRFKTESVTDLMG